ncbi:MAG: hypothetical protein EB141_00965 [Verrucomicrobia bacterium]|nr:hypothetical protein [Verrucomicrobiota bacterium]NBU09343.1 hypothetical protein [Pseudomonadota bacterium]NDA65374.1 hypothetical protein [Verrucomicrobiota bacterium]NDB74214.1 hypothetical protein [Verrucomicrobiota bacterium]NDD36922.1 hypothetical protein [Verrucomicrobiota bacterium]
MSKDASRELVAEMAGVYRDAEEARVASFARLQQEAQERPSPICAGQPVWVLHLEPVTAENAVNHPGYVVLSGEVLDTRETTYEVSISGRVRTCLRTSLYPTLTAAEQEAQRCNATIARRLAELHDGGLA